MVNLREDVATGSVRLDKSIKKIRTELELNKIKKHDSDSGEKEVLDKDGEPVSDYTTKHFYSYANLIDSTFLFKLK